MRYYKSNALYEYITAKHLQRFKFVVGDAWQLVYGDNSCNPLLLILASGVPNAELENPPSAQEVGSIQSFINSCYQCKFANKIYSLCF